MPTYEYKCRDCGHQLEVVQSFTDDALTKCPSCRKKALRKVFSPVGIAFKGSGFYKTDSRSSNGKSASSTNGSSSEKSDKADKASSSSDAKSIVRTALVLLGQEEHLVLVRQEGLDQEIGSRP